jgi:hypothetical protein
MRAMGWYAFVGFVVYVGVAVLDAVIAGRL